MVNVIIDVMNVDVIIVDVIIGNVAVIIGVMIVITDMTGQFTVDSTNNLNVYNMFNLYIKYKPSNNNINSLIDNSINNAISDLLPIGDILKQGLTKSNIYEVEKVENINEEDINLDDITKLYATSNIENNKELIETSKLISEAINDKKWDNFS
jgi:hypothetical protein